VSSERAVARRVRKKGGTKNDVMLRVRKAGRMTRELAKELTEAFVDAVVEEIVAAGELNLPRLGKFRVIKLKGYRTDNNPFAGGRVRVLARHCLKFRVCTKLRDRVREAFAATP
jgi:nucleoid DNA-binding protein